MADQGQQPGSRPAGWKKDPSGRHFGRWWDGEQWTENVISAEKVQGIDPVPPRPEPSIFGDGAPPPAPPSPAARPAVPVRPVESAAPTFRGPVPTAPGWTPESAPKKRGAGRAWKIGLGVILGFFVLVIACTAIIANGAKDALENADPTPATPTSDGTPNTSPAGTAPAARTTYKVGDTAKTGDFEVTVYGFKDPQTTTNQFDKPAAGHRYVSVDVQVANKGSNQQVFSSLLGFHLVDSANRQYDLEITTVEPKAPDGQIPAGGAIRGIAVFEIPEGTTGMRLRVQGNITASGAFFALT